MKRDALNERCAWMGRETVLFAAARAKGTTREQAMSQVETVDLHEPNQAAENRAHLGLPDERTDLRDVVRRVYDADASIAPDQLGAQVAGECSSSSAQ
jgi:hypothetical protein